MWSSNKPELQQGLTFIELLVTLVILSILAAAALPYAELTIKRNKELELRRSLRDIRTAIDRFHEDWRTGRIPKFAQGASENGYPTALMVLVEGMEASGGDTSGKRRYLRRIPLDPFAKDVVQASEQWLKRSYLDDPDALTWGGQDVYDVRSPSETTAINGTVYKEW